MRILILETHPMWIYGLPNGFRDSGHTIFVPEKVDETNIHALFEEFKPDLSLAMSWTFSNVSVQSQQSMRKAASRFKVPLVYWDTEGPVHFDEVIVPLVKEMNPDFVFTIYAEKIKNYNALGFKAAALDFGYHPDVHFPLAPQAEFACPIALVANSYYKLLHENKDFYRLEVLKTLINPIVEMGLPIHLYGRDWDKMSELLEINIPSSWLKGYLSYEEVNKVYSSASLVLGVQNEPNKVSQRTYEILASGGCLLTVDSPGIREVGEAGKDFLVTDSYDDTKRIVKYYLDNPTARQSIQLNGRATVAKHSYLNRATYVMEILKKENVLKRQG